MDRRKFLRRIGLSGAVAATATAVPLAIAAKEPEIDHPDMLFVGGTGASHGDSKRLGKIRELVRKGKVYYVGP